MHNKRFKIIKEKLLYLTSFLLALNLLLFSFFQLSVNRNILRGVSALICISVLLVSRKINKTDFGLLIVGAYLILINGHASINMAFIIMMTISMAFVDREKLLKNYKKVHLFILILVVASLLLGIVHNIHSTYLGRTRDSFGFVHVNYVGLLSFSAISVYLMNKKRPKWYDYGACLLLSIILFRFTDSRTGFYGTILMMFFSFLLSKLNENKSKVIAGIIVVLFFLSPIIWGLPFINNNWMNSLLSYRPRIFTNYINSNSFFSLIFGGSKISEIDNSYLVYLFNCGIIIYLVTGLIVLLATIDHIKKGNRSEAAFIIATLAIAMTESSLLRCELPFTIYFWLLILEGFKQGRLYHSVFRNKGRGLNNLETMIQETNGESGIRI